MIYKVVPLAQTSLSTTHTERPGQTLAWVCAAQGRVPKGNDLNPLTAPAQERNIKASEGICCSFSQHLSGSCTLLLQPRDDFLEDLRAIPLKYHQERQASVSLWESQQTQRALIHNHNPLPACLSSPLTWLKPLLAHAPCPSTLCLQHPATSAQVRIEFSSLLCCSSS